MNTTIKKTEKQSAGIVVLFFLSLWFIANAYLCAAHEPMRDEAQSWMITKHNNLLSIARFLWQEGHPMLLYLFLYPFTHLGFPFEYSKWLFFGLTAVAVFLFLTKAQFGNFWKCVFLVIPPVFYFAPCFSRSYTLVLFFAVLLGCLWKTRLSKPLRICFILGLFSGIHILTWMPTIVLAFFLFAEQVRKHILSVKTVAGFVVPLVILNAPLLPQIAMTMQRFGIGTLGLVSLFLLGIGLYAAAIYFVGRSNIFGKFLDNPVASFYGFLVIGVVTAVTSYILCMVIVKSSIAALFTFAKYFSQVSIFLPFAFAAFEYRSATEKPLARRERIGTSLAVLLPIAILLSLKWTWILYPLVDSNSLFSSGKETAEFIENNLPDDAVIYSAQQGTTPIVTVYLEEKAVLNHYDDRPIYYTRWYDRWNQHTPEKDWKPQIEDALQKNGTIYLLHGEGSDFEGLNDYLAEKENAGMLEVVFTSEKAIIYPLESFRIIKLTR